jgi:hypothetical protein
VVGRALHGLAPGAAVAAAAAATEAAAGPASPASPLEPRDRDDRDGRGARFSSRPRVLARLLPALAARASACLRSKAAKSAAAPPLPPSPPTCVVPRPPAARLLPLGARLAGAPLRLPGLLLLPPPSPPRDRLTGADHTKQNCTPHMVTGWTTDTFTGREARLPAPRPAYTMNTHPH